MDKLTRALSLAEDSATRLKMLEAQASRYAKILALDGSGASATSFGQVSVSSPSAVVAVFSGAASARLMFCGTQVASGPSPIIAVIDKGSGELALDCAATNATALVIGGATK